MPTETQRNGDFSQLVDLQGKPVQLYDPTTGLPYLNNKVPISSEAQALLKLYPLPNFMGNSQYNYQIPLITNADLDSVYARLDKTVGRKDQLSGTFALSSTRGNSVNLLNFLDATDGLGISSTVNWSHTFSAHLRANLGYQFSRQSNRLTPYWANRTNISGDAGIMGNNQEPTNWGPPTLSFTSGLTSMTDGVSSFNRNDQWDDVPNDVEPLAA